MHTNYGHDYRDSVTDVCIGCVTNGPAKHKVVTRPSQLPQLSDPAHHRAQAPPCPSPPTDRHTRLFAAMSSSANNGYDVVVDVDDEGDLGHTDLTDLEFHQSSMFLSLSDAEEKRREETRTSALFWRHGKS